VHALNLKSLAEFQAKGADNCSKQKNAAMPEHGHFAPFTDKMPEISLNKPLACVPSARGTDMPAAPVTARARTNAHPFALPLRRATAMAR
jgi:hypothetical protein